MLLAVGGSLGGCGEAVDRYVVVTGSDTGVYYQVGQAIDAMVRRGDSGIRLSVRTSGGSVDNARQLAAGAADFAMIQNLPQRFEVQIRQGINQDRLPWNGNLEQTKLLRIGMKTVRLGIQGDPWSLTNATGEISQILCGANHEPRHLNEEQGVREAGNSMEPQEFVGSIGQKPGYRTCLKEWF
jgi:hypothetical protein